MDVSCSTGGGLGGLGGWLGDGSGRDGGSDGGGAGGCGGVAGALAAQAGAPCAQSTKGAARRWPGGAKRAVLLLTLVDTCAIAEPSAARSCCAVGSYGEWGLSSSTSTAKPPGIGSASEGDGVSPPESPPTEEEDDAVRRHSLCSATSTRNSLTWSSSDAMSPRSEARKPRCSSHGRRVRWSSAHAAGAGGGRAGAIGEGGGGEGGGEGGGGEGGDMGEGGGDGGVGVGEVGGGDGRKPCSSPHGGARTQPPPVFRAQTPVPQHPPQPVLEHVATCS